jgi:hypothetical protein
MSLPERIEPLCQALIDGLKAVLEDKLYGVVLYGALAFPETASTGDVDGHVIVREPLTEQEKANLRELHADLARDHPSLGADLDIYYLLLADTRGSAPPAHQLVPGIVDGSWSLHCAHIRAGRCIVLYGPDPTQDYPAPAWEDLEAALRGELAYVERHLADYPAYCALNLCRLVYSYQTRDVVVSKARAAAWAWQAFPEWRSLIDAARRSYAGQATAQDDALLRLGVPSLLRFALEQIRRCAACAPRGGQARQAEHPPNNFVFFV